MTRTVPTRDAAADDGSHAIADPCWSARPTGTAVMLIVTSLVSLAATIIIMVERAILTADPTYVTSCDINPWISCGRVMQSWQAMTFGFPNPLIGLVAFPMLITVGAALLAGSRFARWFWVLLNIGLVGGLAFAAWLWYAAVYSIGTLCLYCMVVWAMVIVQTVLITSRNLQTGALPVGPRIAALARDLAWPVIVLLWVLVAASILMEMGLGVIGLG